MTGLRQPKIITICVLRVSDFGRDFRSNML
jgi:hypothetical protein